MNITSVANGAFVVETKTATVGINTPKGDISIFSAYQPETNNDTTIHWPGEYETKGVSVFISPVIEKESLVKIFAEGIRVVFFSDTSLHTVSEKEIEFFGNTDILLCTKTAEGGISSAEYKKLIEKIDPRVIVAGDEASAAMLKSFSFPVQEVSKYSVVVDKLPMDTSEYYYIA